MKTLRAIGTGLIFPFKMLGKALLWLLLLPWRVLTGKGARPRFKVEETVVYSMHRSFFLWALIVVGWGVAWLERIHPAVSPALSWFYLWCILYTFMLALYDIGTVKLIAIVVPLALAWLILRYTQDVFGATILSHASKHFKGLHPVINPGFASLLSWMLLPLWIESLIEGAIKGRKSFSPNGVEERVFGVGKEITDRTGLHFVCRYRNLAVTILGFGAGDLEAIDSEGKIVKRWANIVGLFFAWKRLDEILRQRSAVVDNAASDPVEVEQVRRPAVV